VYAKKKKTEINRSKIGGVEKTSLDFIGRKAIWFRLFSLNLRVVRTTILFMLFFQNNI